MQGCQIVLSSKICAYFLVVCSYFSSLYFQSHNFSFAKLNFNPLQAKVTLTENEHCILFLL